MTLTARAVERYADEYRNEEPLYTVEAEQVETLPDAFAEGAFGRRDAEWVVQWYYRRFLGDVPDSQRRDAEKRFEDNDFDAVRDAIVTAAGAEPAAALERLTALDGVDVPVGSAFLAFLDPSANVVVGEREWTVLFEADELSSPYPDPFTVDDYETYLTACRTLMERLDCDGWTLYMALWRRWKDEHGSG